MDTVTQQQIYKLSTQGKYQNLREIGLGGIPFTVREALMVAPIIAGLNVYMIGQTGEGKSELGADMASLFGDSYCYAEGRPDFELNELFKLLRLDKKSVDAATSDKELIELTENVRKAFYNVEELNRAPPLIQNYFFNFGDGKFMHNGLQIKLGYKGYSILYASGNIGNGAYVGVSETDRALKDRMNLIIKLDDPDFATTELDDVRIFGSGKRPRASTPDTERACLDDVLALHEEFKKREIPVVLPLVGVYFHKGLDYLEGTPRHSKRAVAETWPNVPSIRQDTDEGMIMPLSKRAVLATIALTQALEMIAESKGKQVTDTIGLFVDTLKLTIPYSGIFAPNYVKMKHHGDVYAAHAEVMEAITGEFSLERKQALEAAVAAATYGAQHDEALEILSAGSGKWSSVRRAIEAEISAQPEENKKTMAVLVEELKRGELTDSKERKLWQTPLE